MQLFAASRWLVDSQEEIGLALTALNHSYVINRILAYWQMDSISHVNNLPLVGVDFRFPAHLDTRDSEDQDWLI